MNNNHISTNDSSSNAGTPPSLQGARPVVELETTKTNSSNSSILVASSSSWSGSSTGGHGGHHHNHAWSGVAPNSFPAAPAYSSYQRGYGGYYGQHGSGYYGQHGSGYQSPYHGAYHGGHGGGYTGIPGGAIARGVWQHQSYQNGSAAGSGSVAHWNGSPLVSSQKPGPKPKSIANDTTFPLGGTVVQKLQWAQQYPEKADAALAEFESRKASNSSRAKTSNKRRNVDIKKIEALQCAAQDLYGMLDASRQDGANKIADLRRDNEITGEMEATGQVQLVETTHSAMLAAGANANDAILQVRAPSAKRHRSNSIDATDPLIVPKKVRMDPPFLSLDDTATPSLSDSPLEELPKATPIKITVEDEKCDSDVTASLETFVKCPATKDSPEEPVNTLAATTATTVTTTEVLPPSKADPSTEDGLWEFWLRAQEREAVSGLENFLILYGDDHDIVNMLKKKGHDDSVISTIITGAQKFCARTTSNQGYNSDIHGGLNRAQAEVMPRLERLIRGDTKVEEEVKESYIDLFSWFIQTSTYHSRKKDFASRRKRSFSAKRKSGESGGLVAGGTETSVLKSPGHDISVSDIPGPAICAPADSSRKKKKKKSSLKSENDKDAKIAAMETTIASQQATIATQQQTITNQDSTIGRLTGDLRTRVAAGIAQIEDVDRRIKNL